MKDYSQYNALELAQDDDFLRWAKNPAADQQLDAQWAHWINQNPDRKEIVDEARRLIKAVTHERQYPLSQGGASVLWARIEDTLAEDHAPEVAPVVPRRTPYIWYSLAAVVSALIALAVWYTTRQEEIPFITETGTTRAEAPFLKVTNESGKVHIILLEDGSTISLQPHSTLEYPEKFSNEKRDVYLQGEAFFDIARDPQRPFSVHTNALVTQVLGTSFRVRAFDAEKDIVVAVKSGKVSVSEHAGKKSADSNKPKSVALLTANQQVVFSKTESRMIKTLVEAPVVKPESAGKEKFNFDDMPIRDVFATLEEAYEVEIIYDEEVMSNCYLNASLDGVPFYDQLRMICKGINAEYEVLDAHVIISGDGCN